MLDAIASIAAAALLLLGPGRPSWEDEGSAPETVAESSSPARDPSYAIRELDLPANVLASAVAVDHDGTLYVGSAEGRILRVRRLARSERGQRLPVEWSVFASTFDHPCGLLAEDGWVTVTDKLGVTRMADLRGEDGVADHFESLTTAWGLSELPHNWEMGLVRDSRGNLYCGTDYPANTSGLLRGKAVRITPEGATEEFAAGLRSPFGWAIDADDRLFCSDNQGDLRLTNEIFWVREGGYYGYPDWQDPSEKERRASPSAVQVPYSLGGSINGLAIVPEDGSFGPFGGQLLAASWQPGEVLRVQMEEVGGDLQGAVYRFLEGVRAPLSLAFGPDGALYVGSMGFASWEVPEEKGGVYAVTYEGGPVFEIRETRLHAGGFELRFTRPVDPESFDAGGTVTVESFHYVYVGDYYAAVRDRVRLAVGGARLSDDGLQLRFDASPLREGFIHEIGLRGLRSLGGRTLAHRTVWYTLNHLPG